MAARSTQSFKLSPLDNDILGMLAASHDGIALPIICDRLFPAWSPVWVRERVRRLGLVGIVTIDATHTPSIVRAARPRRRSPPKGD